MARTGSRLGTSAVLAVLVAIVGASCGGRVQGGSSEPTPSPPPVPGPAPSGGTRFVDGSGYRFVLPPGWHDAVAVAVSGPSTLAVDRAVAGQVQTHDVTPTVWVMLEPTSATLEAYARLRRGVLGASADAQTLSLAGVPALAMQSAEGDLLTHEVICVRHGRAYVIDFTAHHDSFAADAAALEQIVNGWSWV